MSDQKRYNPDDSILASDLNQRSEAIERINSLSAVAPFSVVQTQTGTHIDRRRREPIYAQLTGSSSPYDWTKVVEKNDGTWETTTVTGTANAYEVNGMISLDSKVVLMYPDGFGDYRFQWIASGTTSCSNQICITVYCGITVVSGATVVLKQGATTIDSTTTNMFGIACFASPAAGTYTFEVSKTGYTSASLTVTLTDCESYSGTVQLLSTTAKIRVTVNLNCLGDTRTVDVEITGPVSLTGTVTPGTATDFTIGGSGTYTVTASVSRYTTGTASVTLGTCSETQNVTINLDVDPDYVCIPCCDIPLSKTFDATINGDSYTLVYQGSLGTTFYWAGCIMKSVSGHPLDGGGNADCPAPLTTISTAFTATFLCNFSGWQLTVAWCACGDTYAFPVDCSAVYPSGACPSPGSLGASGVETGYVCDPFEWDGTIDMTPYGSGSVTITEA